MAPSNTGGSALGKFKLIVLDEADAMTSTAQMALRRIMERYTANTRFCVIANYTHKISPALLSRCTRFRFSPLKEADIRSLIDHVIEKEQVLIQSEAVDSLVTLSKGDMRRSLNVLQACHASSKNPLSISQYTHSPDRHTPSDEKCSKKPTTPRTRDDHQSNDLRLYSCPSSIRCPRNHGDSSFHQRRHIMPQHCKHPEIHQRPRSRRYSSGSQRPATATNGPGANEDYLAGGSC